MPNTFSPNTGSCLRQRRLALATLELLEKYLRRATSGDGPESHVARVAVLAMDIARELHVPADFLAGIEAAGLLHDIGDSEDGFYLVEKSGLTRLAQPESRVGVALPILIARRKRSVSRGERVALQTSARILAVADLYDDLTQKADPSARFAPWPAVEELERRCFADRVLINALRHVLQHRFSADPAPATP